MLTLVLARLPRLSVLFSLYYSYWISLLSPVIKLMIVSVGLFRCGFQFDVFWKYLPEMLVFCHVYIDASLTDLSILQFRIMTARGQRTLVIHCKDVDVERMWKRRVSVRTWEQLTWSYVSSLLNASIWSLYFQSTHQEVLTLTWLIWLYCSFSLWPLDGSKTQDSKCNRHLNHHRDRPLVVTVTNCTWN